MIIDDLLDFVRERMKSKRTSANARILWRNMERALENGKAGWIGLRSRKVTDEDLCMWALNCALLHNGLSFQWMPLSSRTTITEARKRKKKQLPAAIHNWMMLSSSNEWTREYLDLMEGTWRRRT